MKYNVGDMVRIRPLEECAVLPGFVSRMRPLCGKPAIITEVDDKDEIYKIRPMQVEDINLDWNWHFSEEMFVE